MQDKVFVLKFKPYKMKKKPWRILFGLYLSCGIKYWDMRKFSLFFLVLGMVMLSSCTREISSVGTENESEKGSTPDEDKAVVFDGNVMLGYNGRSTEGPHGQTGNSCHWLPLPERCAIRYPGGTKANSWDWKAGKLVDKMNPKYLFRIKDLVAGIPETLQVIYVMNMVNTPVRWEWNSL